MGEPLDVLTNREREVFWLVADRLRNLEIAEQLFVSERTVESHVASLLRKLGGTDRRDLVAQAARLREDLPGAARLPRVLSSFVGRETDVQALSRLVARERLIALTGPAGVGKTRLAFHVADRAQGMPPPVLVDLATIPPDAPVERAFAAALGLFEDTREIRAALRDALREGRHWLILDNAEHVVEPCAHLLRDLVTVADGLHVLATSQAPLRVPGEVVVDVTPLDLPPSSDDPSLVLGAASARLFADRAVSAVPGFTVTSANARDVATLCRRLDGLPLAIELAAARIRTFSAAELVRHLDDRFGLLTEERSHDSGRHATLEDALRWSHELLHDEERVLFERLSAFPGEFDYDTACDVAAHHPLDVAMFLRLFPSLLDRSLLSSRRSADRATSYRMLESFRAFGQARLAERGELLEMADRHAQHHVDRAVALVPDLQGRDQPTALRWFTSHAVDLAAGMRHLLHEGDREQAWRLVGGVGKGWLIVGIRGELFEWLDHLLAHPLPDGQLGLQARVTAAYLLVFKDTQRAVELAQDAQRHASAEDPTARSLADLVLGWTLAYRGDDQLAIEHLTRACESFRALGDTWHEATAWQGLGRACREVGASVDHLQHAADRFREVGDQTMQANCVTMLATRCLEYNSRLDDVQTWLNDARHLAEASENAHELLHVELHLARLHQLRGDHAAAAPVFARVLPHLRRIGDHRCARRCLIGLGWAALVNGDDAAARTHLTAGVELARDVLDPRETAAGLRLLAVLAHHTGDPRGASELEQAADRAASQLDPVRREALPTVPAVLQALSTPPHPARSRPR